MDVRALPFLYRMLLAHFLADFPLQPDELYRWKSRSFWGSAIHGTVFGLLALVLAAPIVRAVWWAVVLLTAFHILIDHLKVGFSLKRGSDSLVLFLADQAAHIGVIIAAAYVLPPSVLVGVRGFLLPEKAVVILAFVVLSAFGGTIFLHMLKRAIWPSASGQGPNNGCGWSGVVERAFITGLVAFNLWPAVPVVAAAKGVLLHVWLKPKGEERRRVLFIDVLASATFALALGILAVRLPVGR